MASPFFILRARGSRWNLATVLRRHERRRSSNGAAAPAGPKNPGAARTCGARSARASCY